MSISQSYLGSGFRLTLNEDWREIETPDPEQFAFENIEDGTYLVISSMLFSIDPSRVQAMAEEVYRSRTVAEHSYTFGSMSNAVDQFSHSVPLYEQQNGFLLLLYSSKGVGENRSVFCGMFRSDIMINIYASSEQHDFDYLQSTLNFIIGHLQIQPPPPY